VGPNAVMRYGYHPAPERPRASQARAPSLPHHPRRRASTARQTMKLLIKLALVLVLVLGGISAAGYFLVPPAAQKAAESGSRYAFGVPAKLEGIGAKLGLGTTGIGFRGYSLQSPEGFDPALLTIGEFRLGVGTSSLISEPKAVDEFVLEGVELTLVQNGTKNNLVPVLQHLSRLADGGADAPDAEDEEAPSEEEGSPGPRLRVGKVSVKGIAARFVVDGIPGVASLDERFEIPAYEADFSSVMGEEGKTAAEVAGLIVTDLRGRALTVAEGELPPEIVAVLEKTLDGGLQGGLGGALDAGKDALEGALEGKKDELEGAAREKAEQAEEDAKKAIDEAVKEGAGKAKEEVRKGLGGLVGGDGR